MQHTQRAGLMSRDDGAADISKEPDAEPQLLRALLQQLDIGGDDHIARPIAGGDGETQIGPDAGRLT
ncbi:hypothetical protein GCM10011487_50660 [Steroidobacter agaridevorans]|uniref:Uncharacterized protein n=1 Tax=Steroidobacter agaridevorans TaxID=2695856 RepID=A0A829YKN5_9GAMM|nr:hypothetical protein GCM10011487_50660 [Steroidobacter agaridevorans]GFE86146.1 hypothetical protein GCM10011488_11000 [Steroidobacter agaridevorans]